MPGTSKTNIRPVFELVSAYYRSDVFRFGNLEFNTGKMHQPFESFPRLKGKAAKSKDLLGPLSEVWKELGKGYEFYDDTDFSYADNNKPVENSRTRVKQSKQEKADGTRFAPWMVIDEKMVDKTRKEREANKKKTGKFFG